MRKYLTKLAHIYQSLVVREVSRGSQTVIEREQGPCFCRNHAKHGFTRFLVAKLFTCELCLHTYNWRARFPLLLCFQLNGEAYPDMTNHSYSTDPFRLVITMPVFRDWDIAGVLCQQIDQQLGQLDSIKVRIVLIDDGSPAPLRGWSPFAPVHISRIDMLLLKRNMGHQRAIAMGLCMIENEIECDAVLVMDADGEDRAEDVIRLINAFRENPDCIVFAGRQRRYEGVVFRTGYRGYRLLYWLLTGVAVREGNFSIMSHSALDRLVVMSELWNHYAGAVYKSKLAHVRLATDRGRRLGGKSHMNFVALVVHGLAGISIFYDVVATRILMGSVFCVIALFIIMAIVFGIRLYTNLAIPGWATYTSGLLLVLVIQIASIAFSLVFSLITTRLNMTFVPARDYLVFFDRVETIWS
jgi:glycosyltransferase involved in cell wall biosynthesis